jgi:hypothetical protein
MKAGQAKIGERSGGGEAIRLLDATQGDPPCSGRRGCRMGVLANYYSNLRTCVQSFERTAGGFRVKCDRSAQAQRRYFAFVGVGVGGTGSSARRWL